jgi:hypothetical protein
MSLVLVHRKVPLFLALKGLFERERYGHGKTLLFTLSSSSSSLAWVWAWSLASWANLVELLSQCVSLFLVFVWESLDINIMFKPAEDRLGKWLMLFSSLSSASWLLSRS